MLSRSEHARTFHSISHYFSIYKRKSALICRDLCSGLSNFTILVTYVVFKHALPTIRAMSSSDLSELTSNVSTDDEALQAPAGRGKLDHYFKHGSVPTQAPPPLKKKRPPSPPHEYVLADNQDVAVSCTLVLEPVEVVCAFSFVLSRC